MNVFEKAAKSVPGHWYKGDYTDGKGNFCAAGHVMLAQGYSENDIRSGAADDDSSGNTDFMAHYDLLNSLAAEFSNGVYGFVAEFNDDEATDEDDIVTLLEKAAVRWNERT